MSRGKTQKRSASRQVFYLQVEHVRVVRTVFRNIRQFNKPLLGQRCKPFTISIPTRHAGIVDDVGTFHLIGALYEPR